MVFFFIFGIVVLIGAVSAAPAEGTCPGGYKEGEKVVKGQYWAECKNGQLVPKGCVSADGGHYSSGETYEKGNYWYTCETSGSSMAPVLSGCVNSGNRLKSGDRFFRGDVSLECDVRDGHENYKVAGCIEQDPKTGKKLEMLLGCTWEQGETYQITMRCKANEETKTAKAEPVHCKYGPPGRITYPITFGCYRMIEKVAVGCQLDSNGNAKVFPIPVDGNGKVIKEPEGLREC